MMWTILYIYYLVTYHIVALLDCTSLEEHALSTHLDVLPVVCLVAGTPLPLNI